MKNIQLIAFDADDTLWINETYFQETEKIFCELLKDFLPDEKFVSQELFKTEMSNLSYYGYGIKGFTLSMIETIIRVSNEKADIQLIKKALELGQELLKKPVKLLNGVEEVLNELSKNYKLVVATKGDLLDQERKLRSSGLEKYLHHIEIMSDKKTDNYSKLLESLDCNPGNFLMVGNSIKSDILPVLELGGYAVHIPFHVTWSHENIEENIQNNHFFQIEKITDLLKLLK